MLYIPVFTEGEVGVVLLFDVEQLLVSELSGEEESEHWNKAAFI